MSNLLDGIKNYLKMNSTGALMVSGDWGCGKTYHIDNVVIPSLIEDGYEPIKVSLFGIESINDIPLRIAENYKGISRTKQADEVNENKKKERKRLFGKKEVGKVGRYKLSRWPKHKSLFLLPFRTTTPTGVNCILRTVIFER